MQKKKNNIKNNAYITKGGTASSLIVFNVNFISFYWLKDLTLI